MAKVLPLRFLPPDDPIFSGGVEMSSHPASKLSSKGSRRAKAGASQATSQTAKSQKGAKTAKTATGAVEV